MNPSRRLALIHAAEVARKHHAKRSHIQRELTWATREQLVMEMKAETKAFWPQPIIGVCAGLAACIVLILWQAGVI